MRPLCWCVWAFLFWSGVMSETRKGRRNRGPPISEHINGLVSESLLSYRVSACHGERVKLHCPAHTQILVDSVFYGRIVPSSELCPPSDIAKWQQQQHHPSEDTSCHVSDAQERVIEKCQTKRKCRITARPKFFDNDPCPGTLKYLQISYKCRPNQFTNTFFCQGVTGNLSCRPGRRLAIHSAMYGRAKHSPGTAECATEKVSQDCTTDVLAKLIPECYAQKQCSLTISDEWLGTPCPTGITAYLHVIYMCVDENVFSEAALEGRLSVVSASSETRIDVAQDDTTTTTTSTSKTTTTTTSTSTSTSHSSSAMIVTYANDTVAVDTTRAQLAATDHFNNDHPAMAPSPHVPSVSSSLPVGSSTNSAPTSVVYLTPTTVIPPSVPNAVSLLDNWIRTYDYVIERKETLLLYFTLSASIGVILLLALCVARQCVRQQPRTNIAAVGASRGHNVSFDRSATNQFGVLVPVGKHVDLDDSTHTQSLLGVDSESRMLYDAGHQEYGSATMPAPSFIRFNSTLTPPRAHTAVAHSNFYAEFNS